MKFNSDFKFDLEIGQMGEKTLASILEGNKIEVKTDIKTKKTAKPIWLNLKQLTLIAFCNLLKRKH